jgi:hypothetical protein
MLVLKDYKTHQEKVKKLPCADIEKIDFALLRNSRN